MHRLYIPFALLLLTTDMPADILVLKSGEVYRGSFVSGSGSRIRFAVGSKTRAFRTRDVERVKFDREPQSGTDVASVRGQETPAVVPDAETTTQQSPEKPYVVVPPANEPPLTIPKIGTNRTTPLGDMGAIDSEFTARGADTGVLGPPRAPSQPTRDGRAVVRFYTNGAIYWTSRGGARAIYGPILEAWMRAGGENSPVGYPISDQEDDDAGHTRSQMFENGRLLWTESEGARIEYSREQ
jgi:hypothetical protein